MKVLRQELHACRVSILRGRQRICTHLKTLPEPRKTSRMGSVAWLVSCAMRTGKGIEQCVIVGCIREAIGEDRKGESILGLLPSSSNIDILLSGERQATFRTTPWCDHHALFSDAVQPPTIAALSCLVTWSLEPAMWYRHRPKAVIGCPVSLTVWARIPALSSGNTSFLHVHVSRWDRVQVIIHLDVSGVRYMLSVCI